MTLARSPLVIIDMQNDYLRNLRGEAREELVSCVVELVKKARAKNRPIVLVTYKGSGPTIHDIQKHLKGYLLLHRVPKRDNDGSEELNELFDTWRVKPKTLTVCGVNLSHCVLETVSGLIARGYRCRVVKESTANSDGEFLERLDDSFDVKYFVDSLLNSAANDLRRLQGLNTTFWHTPLSTDLKQWMEEAETKLGKRLVLVSQKTA